MWRPSGKDRLASPSGSVPCGPSARRACGNWDAGTTVAALSLPLAVPPFFTGVARAGLRWASALSALSAAPRGPLPGSATLAPVGRAPVLHGGRSRPLASGIKGNTQDTAGSLFDKVFDRQHRPVD